MRYFLPAHNADLFSNSMLTCWCALSTYHIPHSIPHSTTPQPTLLSLIYRLSQDQREDLPIGAIMKAITTKDKTAADVLELLEEIKAPLDADLQAATNIADMDSEDQLRRQIKTCFTAKARLFGRCSRRMLRRTAALSSVAAATHPHPLS